MLKCPCSQEHHVKRIAYNGQCSLIPRASLCAQDLVSILTCIVDIVPAAGSIDGTADTSLDDLRIFRMLRVLRLIKLVRLFKTSRLIKRWRTSIALDFSTQTLMFCITTYLLAAHWFACILVLASDFEESPMHSWRAVKGFCVRADEVAELPPRRIWVQQRTSLDPAVAELGDVYCVETFDLWVHTFYWMIQLVSGAAGGDTGALDMTSSECVVFSMLVVGSCLVMSVIIASFCDVLANLNPEHNQFRVEMDRLNRYCRTNKVCKPDSNPRPIALLELEFLCPSSLQSAEGCTFESHSGSWRRSSDGVCGSICIAQSTSWSANRRRRSWSSCHPRSRASSRCRSMGRG